MKNLKHLLTPMLAAALAAPLLAMAGVNAQNGNFYISYSDLEIDSGGHKLTLGRTYNSRAGELGWFGYGWGSLFETRLVVLPEGSVAVQEIGTGAISYYRPDAKPDLQAAVARLVEAARGQPGAQQPQAMARELAGSEELRMRAVIRHGLKTELPQGTQLRDAACPQAFVRRVPEGWLRRHCDARQDRFDAQGRLLQRTEADGYAVSAEYQGGARPTALRDGNGRSMDLSWNTDGRLVAARAGDKSVRFEYDARQDLVKSADPTGNDYLFEYDDNHNLTRIGYIDGSARVIKYADRATGMVAAEIDRQGRPTLYAYRTDPERPGSSFTRITETDAEGHTRTREIEFRRQVSETGVDTLAFVGRTFDNRRSEASTLDDQGRLVRKVEANGRVLQYVYHPRSGKIILAFQDDALTTYHYNEANDLVRATNSEGRTIELHYGADRRIDRMVDTSPDQPPRELGFKYNARGKPTEIAVKGLGRVDVAYDEAGEITKVDSKQGSKIALEITSVMSKLLEMVRVAGVRI